MSDPLTEPSIYELTKELAAIVGPDGAIETTAQVYDMLLGQWCGDVLRDAWKIAVDSVLPLLPWPCDCDPFEHHRWNCATTPIWAQTIRDLDVNPWTVVRDAEMPFARLWHLASYCGLGPCARPGGHDGRCSL